jgi:hypothetical protein
LTPPETMQAIGHYSFRLANIMEADQGLKFFRATMPKGSVEIANVKAWNAQGLPEPVAGGGHQVSWEPIQLTRYADVDKESALAKWFFGVMEKGVVPETKQNPTITCYAGDKAVFTWALTGAVATSYSQSDADAQTHGLMTETVTLTYEKAELKQGTG